MPTWKIFIMLILTFATLGLAFSIIIVPMTEFAGDMWWAWMLGLTVATAAMGGLLMLFLKSADKKFSKF
jgi:hypothetical protein